MNVTREVVMDLLPIYFSDEASADTKMLVEDYFRQDPDFERIARSAAKPLETLRAAAPIKASSEKEKRDLESILWGLRRRTWLFGVSLFLTLVPLSFDFTHGHIVSLTVRGNLWHAAFDWSLAAVLWFLYFARRDLLYADPHSLRLALCVRRRASSGVRHRLVLGSTDLGGVFPAAPLLSLLRTLAQPINPADDLGEGSLHNGVARMLYGRTLAHRQKLENSKRI